MATLANVWVIGEKPDQYASLCAFARTMGDKVSAVVVGTADDAAAVATAGADEVLLAAVPEGGLFEDGVSAVVAAVAERAPQAVVCATTKRLRLAAARIAAACGTRVLNDATALSAADDGSVVCEHMVFGGSAYATERAGAGTCAVATLADALLLANEGAAGSAAPVEELAAGAPSGIELVERKPRTVEAVNLSAARRVVSVGRGFEKEEDLALANDLAAALEAEVGCTRPIAEGEGWMARERYIGVSGAMCKPDLFVAAGVSGQVQHMVGVTGAKTVVAINKDKNAPVFKQVDYGIVGDLYDVLPKLTAALSA